MSVETLLRREDGVSKVVGVVLMVAITVLLAAVIGLMMSGMSEEAPTQAEVSAIQASFSFEFGDNTTYDPDPTAQEPGAGQLAPSDSYTADNLTITFEGGSRLASENLVVQMTGSESGFKYIKPNGDLGGGASHQSERTFDGMQAPSELTAGDSITITTIVDDVVGSYWSDLTTEMESTSVRIVYQAPASGDSYILAEWSGPQA